MKYVHAVGAEAIEGIKAGFSMRNGGVSEAPFASLNLSFSSRDVRSLVEENRRLLSEPLGFSPDRIAIAGLVHGNRVAVVTKPGLVNDVDGLVSKLPDILLCVTAADCAIVLLADPVNRIIGACHAGWRGAVAGVVSETIVSMAGLGADAQALRAFISPCISQEHFEVGPEVAERFAPEFVSISPVTGKQHVDLKGSLVTQLQDAGVSDREIEVSADCTFRDTHKYFSYRAENGKTGRMMGFIGQTSGNR